MRYWAVVATRSYPRQVNDGGKGEVAMAGQYLGGTLFHFPILESGADPVYETGTSGHDGKSLVRAGIQAWGLGPTRFAVIFSHSNQGHHDTIVTTSYL